MSPPTSAANDAVGGPAASRPADRATVAWHRVSRETSARRLLEVLRVLLVRGIAPLLVPRRWRRAAGPVRLRRALETLGGGWAKLGQVHGAVLHDGRRVAVKVQRPGIGALLMCNIALCAASR